MISPASLRDAAFWGHQLCLDCSATFDASIDLCPVCGSTRLLPSEDALAVLSLLDLEAWIEEASR